jgi:glycosyltransferase involved in cell wall biosynthesis
MPTKYIFLTSSSLKSSKPTENRLLPFIKKSLEKGYLVKLISPDSEQISYKNDRFEHSALNLENTKSSFFIIRLFTELYISLKICLKVREKESKIFLTTPSPLLIFFAFLFKRNNLIVDIRDLTWEYLPSSSYLQKFIKIIAKKTVHLALSYPATITTSNSYEKSYIEKTFGAQNKVHLVSNGISLDKFSKLTELKHNKNNPSVGYFGSLGKAQGIDTIAVLAKKNPNINFLICGDGSEKERITKLSKKLNVSNLVILKTLDEDSLIRKYSEVNILFSQLSSDFKSALPSKLYEYLSTGKCILYSGLGEAANFLNHFENCHIVDHGDINAIDKKLKFIVRENHYLSISKKNREKIRKRFIREELVSSFYDDISW